MQTLKPRVHVDWEQSSISGLGKQILNNGTAEAICKALKDLRRECERIAVAHVLENVVEFEVRERAYKGGQEFEAPMHPIIVCGFIAYQGDIPQSVQDELERRREYFIRLSEQLPNKEYAQFRLVRNNGNYMVQPNGTATPKEAMEQLPFRASIPHAEIMKAYFEVFKLGLPMSENPHFYDPTHPYFILQKFQNGFDAVRSLLRKTCAQSDESQELAHIFFDETVYEQLCERVKVKSQV